MIEGIRKGGFVGVNVTIPHKEAVLTLADADLVFGFGSHQALG